jgi:hypothetical protein
MLPGLVRQDGYDYNAIKVVLDVYGVEQKGRPRIMTSINKLIDVINAEKRAREK